MTQGYFITGTDTEVGKTFTTCVLLHHLAGRGRRVAAMKPVAAGLDAAGLNEDVELLFAASNMHCARDLINPYAFRSPIAPHLAAAEEGREIRFGPILAAFETLSNQVDTLLVEGVGGFRVPLGPDGDSADLVQDMNIPLILVVGLRLGCINHALLTVEAIETRGLRLAGWVGNCVDPAMAQRDENISTLVSSINAPLLGVLPWMDLPDPAAAVGFITCFPGQGGNA